MTRRIRCSSQAPEKHSKKAEYLGVSIDKDGVTTTKAIDRLRSARSRIGLLSTLGMFKGGFKTERNVTIFRAFIQPVFEYCVHLVPRTPKLDREAIGVYQTLATCFFGKRTEKKWRRLMRLWPD